MEVSVNLIHKTQYIFIVLHITIIYEIFIIGGGGGGGGGGGYEKHDSIHKATTDTLLSYIF